MNSELINSSVKICLKFNCTIEFKMDTAFTEENFLPIVDIWIQQRNFLFLKSAYDNFPWVREYINREEKLNRLETIDFYLGYFEDLRSRVDIHHPEAIIELLDFTRDSISAKEIYYEVSDQMSEIAPSLFFLYKYKVFGEILYRFLQHSNMKFGIEKLIDIIYEIHNSIDANTNYPDSIPKDYLIINYAIFQMFREGRFQELEELKVYDSTILVKYCVQNPDDVRAIEQLAEDYRKSEIHILNISTISTDLADIIVNLC